MGIAHAKSFDGERHEKGPSKKIELTGIKAKVEKIHVDGLERTHDDIVMASVKELFAAQDFQDVVLKAQAVRSKLERLGCFKQVGVLIDTSTSPGASPEGLEVTFTVKETSRVVGSISTAVGNNDGSLVLSGQLPNLVGRGERIQVEHTYGTKKTSGFNVTAIKPFHNSSNAVLSASAFRQHAEYPWSGYRNLDNGLLFELAFNSVPQVHHRLIWEGVWRELGCLNRSTSFLVREQAGHSLKSALRHVTSFDGTDNAIFPTKGVLFRLSQEIAGLGGDVGFVKHETNLQVNCPLPFSAVLQGTLSAGLMQHLNNDKVFNICDRFFLGGPLSVRGFDTRGIGPQSDGNALGAETFWASGLHLYMPLPFRPGQGGFGDLFRLHLFANGGNIGNFQFADDMQQNLQTLVENFRLAYGVGLAMRLGQIGRIELNYCWPVKSQRGDHIVPGVQFGIGMQFL